VIIRILCELISNNIPDLQRKLLFAIADNDLLTASQFVASLNLPKSTGWHNLRQLRNKRLISFGDSKLISLTHTGELILPAVAQSAFSFAKEKLRCQKKGVLLASLGNKKRLEQLEERSAVDREAAGATPARGTEVR